MKLINGRASHAQVYPRALRRAVCEGVAWQKRMDVGNMVSMDVMGPTEIKSFGKDELHRSGSSTKSSGEMARASP